MLAHLGSTHHGGRLVGDVTRNWIIWNNRQECVVWHGKLGLLRCMPKLGRVRLVLR